MFYYVSEILSRLQKSSSLSWFGDYTSLSEHPLLLDLTPATPGARDPVLQDLTPATPGAHDDDDDDTVDIEGDEEEDKQGWLASRRGINIMHYLNNLLP